jgi:hypothetical protein
VATFSDTVGCLTWVTRADGETKVVAMSKPMPEKKDPPFRLVRFVEVPRALVPTYGDRTWAEVVTAAQAGRDGLRVVYDNIFTVNHGATDTALLRERHDTGTCLLFRQNWCDETNDARWRKLP